MFIILEGFYDLAMQYIRRNNNIINNVIFCSVKNKYNITIFYTMFLKDNQQILKIRKTLLMCEFVMNTNKAKLFTNHYMQFNGKFQFR